MTTACFKHIPHCSFIAEPSLIVDACHWCGCFIQQVTEGQKGLRGFHTPPPLFFVFFFFQVTSRDAQANVNSLSLLCIYALLLHLGFERVLISKILSPIPHIHFSIFPLFRYSFEGRHFTPAPVSLSLIYIFAMVSKKNDNFPGRQLTGFELLFRSF